MAIKFEPGETNILCTNLDASLHFYRDILNFEFVAEDKGAIRLNCGEQHYLLLPFAQSRSSVDGYLSTATISIDLLVDDLKIAAEYLKKQGVAFAQAWAAGKPSFLIRDPDGLFIEIIQK